MSLSLTVATLNGELDSMNVNLDDAGDLEY